MPPAHSLEEVRRLAEGAGSVRPDVTRSLAIEPVMARLDLDEVQAVAFILDVVANLGPDDYAETLTGKPPPADVYGVERRGCPWYVKVTIRPPDRLVVISCHPPAHPLRTRSGTIR